MGGRDPDKSSPKRRNGTSVEDGSAQRPFMRGIMVHSLMSRGMSFTEAYRVASAVRDQVRGRSSVTREELRQIVGEVADPKVLRELRHEALVRAPILVTGQGAGAPFSKGFLSQSLLAAAIDPNDAFDVARQIEEQLGRSGTREVDRHELRRLAYEALHHRLGPPAAERYLVWRKHQEPDRPVILLLGGTSGVGKTSLALEVAHRLGNARVLSTDSIRQVMRIMLSPDLVPALHASSYDAHLALDEVAREADEPVLEGFRAQASTVSVGVRAMIDRAIAENTSLILDGVSIVPGLIDLEAYADRAEVIFLLVATLDTRRFATRFAARAETASERPPHRYLENLPAIETIQDYLLELAESHDIPIVDNESFDRSVISIIRHVTETLRKKDKLDVADLFSRPVRAGLVTAALALGLSACSTLSIERERELGDDFAREIRREVTLMRDDVVLTYVDRMGREILAAAGAQPFEYRFSVVENPEINAFAAPAGHIYIHTGTILQSRNASELCGVIAHEIGHVAKRHIANNYDRQRWTRMGHQVLVVGAGAVGGQSAAGAANLLGGLAAMSYLNTFGRDAEREADAFAVEVMPRAGYDPSGLVSFFHTLKNQGGGSPPAFLSSHPATDERIENTRRMIQALPRRSDLRRNDGGRFEIVQHRVRLLTESR